VARLCYLLVLCVSSVALADEWETILDGPPFTVKNRAIPNSAIREVWAEGDLDATVGDIQDTLMHPREFKNFMPNLKAAREIGKPEDDGSFYVYTELDLPVITSRDYVVRVWVDEGVKEDGTGVFRQHWKAAPDKLPERNGLVRVKVNDGSWLITPKGDGSKSHVIYKFATDPGGAVPAFAANIGNKKAVTGTLLAIEKEAQRRAALRKADGGTK
jgi:hypothetical protein